MTSMSSLYRKHDVKAIWVEREPTLNSLETLTQLDWRGKLVAAIMGVQQLSPGKGSEVSLVEEIQPQC